MNKSIISIYLIIFPSLASPTLNSAPATDILEADAVAIDECVVNDFGQVVRNVLPQLEDQLYYRMWHKSVLPEGVDAAEYLSETLPHQGSCHGHAFAIQNALYMHPVMDVTTAVTQQAQENVTLFDVMRLVYTETYTHMVQLEALAAAGVVANPDGITFGQIKEILRDAYYTHVDTLLGSAHKIDIVEHEAVLPESREALVGQLVDALQTAGKDNQRITAYMNIISGDEVHTSLLLTAWAPEYNLVDADHPSLLIPGPNAEGRFNDLKTLVEGALDYAKNTYLPASSEPNFLLIQLVIYGENTKDGPG